MKVREIIAFQVKDLLGAGVTPRYLVISPRALDLLVKEVHAEQGEKASMALLQADATVSYQDMEVVAADLPMLCPILVTGIVREMWDLYNLKVRKT